MGRVLTNTTGIQYAIEATPGVLPGGTPAWKQLEPNSIASFGSTFTKTARNPISKSRQARKGKNTDSDSGLEIEADLTMDHFKDFIEAFVFARAIGPDNYESTAATATGYTVPAMSAGAAGRITYGASAAKTLVFARGFALPANNGLKPVTAVHAAAATELKVAGNAAETVQPTQSAEVSLAGVRAAAGDLEIDADGNLISTVLDFTTLGLSRGQSIHIGGIDITHQFFNEENLGFAELAVIEAHKLTLKNRDQDYVVDDGTSTGAGGADVAIDLLFGQYIRNVDVGAADYLERTFNFELTSPNLGTAGATMYEYSRGNYANTMTLDLALSDLAKTTFNFVGLDTDVPTATRAAGAANAKVPNETDSFSTSSDIARIRLADLDETGMTTDFKSLTLTLSNSVEGEKVLAKIGPAYMNFGNFGAVVESQMLFTNPAIIERIRCNRDLQWDTVLYNSDGGVRLAITCLTLEGGDREYPANQSVLINATGTAYKDPILGISLAVSLFPALPQTGCP